MGDSHNGRPGHASGWGASRLAGWVDGLCVWLPRQSACIADAAMVGSPWSAWRAEASALMPPPKPSAVALWTRIQPRTPCCSHPKGVTLLDPTYLLSPLSSFLFPPSSSVPPRHTIPLPAAVEALDMFLSIVGAEAGNMALRSLASGGVFICGGIFPKVGWMDGWGMW